MSSGICPQIFQRKVLSPSSGSKSKPRKKHGAAIFLRNVGLSPNHTALQPEDCALSPEHLKFQSLLLSFGVLLILALFSLRFLVTRHFLGGGGGSTKGCLAAKSLDVGQAMPNVLPLYGGSVYLGYVFRHTRMGA
jgi:hypothetical protein